MTLQLKMQLEDVKNEKARLSSLAYNRKLAVAEQMYSKMLKDFVEYFIYKAFNVYEADSFETVDNIHYKKKILTATYDNLNYKLSAPEVKTPYMGCIGSFDVSDGQKSTMIILNSTKSFIPASRTYVVPKDEEGKIKLDIERFTEDIEGYKRELSEDVSLGFAIKREKGFSQYYDSFEDILKELVK